MDLLNFAVRVTQINWSWRFTSFMKNNRNKISISSRLQKTQITKTLKTKVTRHDSYETRDLLEYGKYQAPKAYETGGA